MKLDIDINTLKLVIWDLDDSFWKGTLSEGPIEPIDSNIELVRTLVDHGVMNSICSKNDFLTTKSKLEEIEAWDCFVFPSIDWTPKAGRIKDIIESMSLRPVNCLFVDDNEMNLNEAKFYLPDLHVLNAASLGELILQAKDISKEDLSHKRLAQYRILENKVKEKRTMNSPEEFLMQSDIVLEFDEKCIEKADRIAEMIERTNQLNFTKLRSSKEELISTLQDDRYKCATISVHDRYGDYGIVGFYALDTKDNSLLHFLFSCRTMGMGVEQYVYEHLGYPSLEIIGDVANQVKKEKIVTWINNGYQAVTKEDFTPPLLKKVNVLLKGPCDLDSVIPYINVGSGIDLETEFNTVNKDGVAITAFNTTIHTVESQTLGENQINTLLKDAPFLDKTAFSTKLFGQHWDVVFFSILPDGHEGLYQHKDTGAKITFSSNKLDITATSNRSDMLDGRHLYLTHGYNFTADTLDNFKDKYVFKGCISPDEIVSNLKYIREHLDGSTLLVLMLPSEIEKKHCKQKIWANQAENHKKINKAIRSEFLSYKNIEIIDYTQFITSDKSYIDTINHFSRDVYYKIACRIIDIVGNLNKNDNNLLELKSQEEISKYEREKMTNAKINRAKYIARKLFSILTFDIFKIKL